MVQAGSGFNVDTSATLCSTVAVEVASELVAELEERAEIRQLEARVKIRQPEELEVLLVAVRY